MSKGPAAVPSSRRSSSELAGAPAPGRKAQPNRILLARRGLGATGWNAEATMWHELIEVRAYSTTGLAYALVLPGHMLGELAAFVQGAAEAMNRSVPPHVKPGQLYELVPNRRFSDGTLLIAHGAAGPFGVVPLGLSIGQWRLEPGGAQVMPVTIDGQPQLLALHRAGVPALAALVAEAVAAATPTPAGRA